LYLGADYLGYYDSANWKTYMDNDGNFYLGGSSGSLQWNGTTLSIKVDSTGGLEIANGGSLAVKDGGNIDVEDGGIVTLKSSSAYPALLAFEQQLSTAHDFWIYTEKSGLYSDLVIEASITSLSRLHISTLEFILIDEAVTTIKGNAKFWLEWAGVDGPILTFYQPDTTIANDQGYGGIEWFGMDTGNTGVRGYIKGISEGTTGQMGLSFATQGSGASNPQERLRIDNTGDVTIKQDLQVDGDIGVGVDPSYHLDLYEATTGSCTSRYRNTAQSWLVYLDSTSKNYIIRDVTNSRNVIVATEDGLVGIRKTPSSEELEVNGSCDVSGELTAGTKTFKIDHPLYPYDKILYHATVEAPRHDLIYRGIAVLSKGKVTIDIDKESNMSPGTFDTLTQNAVVTSLQNQDSFDRLKPSTIKDGKFDILCENEQSEDRVAWVVMAERSDPLVTTSRLNDDLGRLIPEVNKQEPTKEELELDKTVETKDTQKIGTIERETADILHNKKGFLLHPKSYGEEPPKIHINYVGEDK